MNLNSSSPEQQKNWFIHFDPAQAGAELPENLRAQEYVLPGLSIWGNKKPLSYATRQKPGLTSVFIGRLDEPDALRRTLGIAQEEVVNSAEIALRAYAQFKEAAFLQIKGIYCWFIWDADRRLFYALRDRIGVFPLYYTSAAGCFLLSNSIHSLLIHPQVNKTINRAAIADHLCNRWPRLEETFYEHIRRVPPGNVMRVADQHIKVERYWYNISDEDEIDWLGEDDVGQFDHLFEQATSRCMQKQQTGIFLSGGLDSVSVAAMATDIARKYGFPEPVALSLVFPFPEVNELDVQQRVAKNLGIQQTLLNLSDVVPEKRILQEAIEFNSRMDSIPLSLWMPGYHHLTGEGVKAGCQVILTGSGGDEWLNVSPTYASDLIRRGQFRELNQLTRQYLRSFAGPPGWHYYNAIWRFGIRPLLGQFVGDILLHTNPGLLKARRKNSYLRTQPNWIAPDPTLMAELDQRLDQTVENSIQIQHIKSFYIREMHASLEHPLVSMELEAYHEVSSNFNLLKLAPYQDADLVDFLYRMPPKFLLKGGMAKGLVRESMARRFPDLGFDTQKKIAATGYFRHIITNEGRAAWDLYQQAPVLAELGIIDPKALNIEIENILTSDSRSRKSWLVWNVLSLESWTKRRIL